MADILFRDGKQPVDDIYVAAIAEVTHGDPRNFTFREAMEKVGRMLESRVVRDVMSNAIRGHFRKWG